MRCRNCDGKGGFADTVSGCVVPCRLCEGTGARSDTAVTYPAGSLRYAPQGDSDGETIGVDHFVADSHGAEVCLCRDEATARLFAASPDLVVACRDMLAYFQEGYDHMPTLVEVADRMRAAVAKAEGR